MIMFKQESTEMVNLVNYERQGVGVLSYVYVFCSVTKFNTRIKKNSCTHYKI